MNFVVMLKDLCVVSETKPGPGVVIAATQSNKRSAQQAVGGIGKKFSAQDNFRLFCL